MSNFNTLAKTVFRRDNGSCTSCGTWLDAIQPEGFTDLLLPRSYRMQNPGPANWLTVCLSCQEMLAGARRGDDPKHGAWILGIYQSAGFFVEGRDRPEDVPVWIELPGGPIWYRLTTDGRRVVTVKE